MIDLHIWLPHGYAWAVIDALLVVLVACAACGTACYEVGLRRGRRQGRVRSMRRVRDG